MTPSADLPWAGSTSGSVFFFNDTATTEIYTLSLHDALPISPRPADRRAAPRRRRSPPGPWECAAPPRSEEHTSELQSLAYLVCRLLLEKKKTPDHAGYAEPEPDTRPSARFSVRVFGCAAGSV